MLIISRSLTPCRAINMTRSSIDQHGAANLFALRREYPDTFRLDCGPLHTADTTQFEASVLLKFFHNRAESVYMSGERNRGQPTFDLPLCNKCSFAGSR